MVAGVLAAMVLGAGYLIFATGRSIWFETDVNIQLQENLRKTLERITMELRQTQTGQQQLFDGAGPFATDIIRFSIPIICEAGNSLLDNNGDIAYWGAPLTWGCTDSSCMDADEDCATVDYKSIEYRINNSNQLVRRVLDEVNNLVREDIFAENINDFQIQSAGGLMILQTTVQQATAMNRIRTVQSTANVYFRN